MATRLLSSLTPADEIVLDRLERTVQWADKFVLGFVQYQHPMQLEALREALKVRLAGLKVLEICLDTSILSLLDTITARWDEAHPPDLVCVYGLESSADERQEFTPTFGRLNHDRDLLRRFVPVPLLIWLPYYALGYIVRGAPDFWAWRSGIYEFSREVIDWQTDSSAMFVAESSLLASLSLEEKQAEAAHLESLLQTLEEKPPTDRRGKVIWANLLSQRAWLHRSVNEWETAYQKWEQCLTLYREAEQAEAIARTLLALGIAQHDRGNLDEALIRYQESATQYALRGDVLGGATVQSQIATVALDRGNLTEAEAGYQQAFEIFTAKEDRLGEARTLSRLATVYRLQGNYFEAGPLYAESLQIRERLGDKVGIANTWMHQGLLRFEQGDLAEAEHLWRESSAQFTTLGDQSGTALVQSYLGILAQSQGRLQEALPLLLVAYQILEHLGSPYRSRVLTALQRLRDAVSETTFSPWIGEERGSRAA